MGNIVFDFSNQNFIVTGASSGMGRQITMELTQAGANVLAIARREEKLTELSELCPVGSIVPLVADIADFTVIQQGIETFIIEHGKLSGLVHAAGISDYSPLKTYNDDFVKKMMEISFWSIVPLVQMLHKRKYSEDRASFVLFSSVSGRHGQRGMFAYSAAKAAVSNLVESFSGEIAKRGLRINAVCPGRVATPMTVNMSDDNVLDRQVLGKGHPADVSGVVLFLLSDRSSWITGTNIAVDGGFLAN